MISDTQVDAAVRFLAGTDDGIAQAKADLENMKIVRERVKSRVFLTTDGTVAERNAKADTHADTEAADGNYVAALLAYEKLKAKRERAVLTVDVWRTAEASRRKGNI